MRSNYTLLSAALTLLVPTMARGQTPARSPDRPLVVAHVMPWFEAKPTSPAWGWHWTMNHFDPDKVDAQGRHNLASHDEPMVGAYDSADPDLLEYHALLMRIAGIDGAIIDWYGDEDFLDYARIHRRTVDLVAVLRRRGLRFAVCYEDRVLKAMVERGKIRPDEAVAHARGHLGFAARTWFADPAYLTWDGRPLLMVFGPDYLKPEQWGATLKGLPTAPAFFTLHERRGPATGAFAWPPMWASQAGVLGPAELDAYLDRFRHQAGAKIPAAFPGFHDIYAQAGTQPSYGFLDRRGGATLRRTLDAALAPSPPLIQLATWNDFGEGTEVEPTREAGFGDLETIQEARRRFPRDPFPFRAADLRLPLRVFRLRKQRNLAAPDRKALDEAVDLLFAGETAPATDRVGRLERAPRPRR